MNVITNITDAEEKVVDQIADHIPFLPKVPTATTNDSSSQSPVPNLGLGDILAPLEIEVDFNQIRIDHRLFRSFFVSAYPRYIEPNWLEPLVDFDHSLNLSMFIYPTNSKTVLDDLRRKIAEMEATIQTDIENNRPVNPSVQIALDDAQALQEQLAKGAERFFNFGLYITVPAETKEDLNNTSKLVESTLGSISITARTTTLQMEDAFLSTMPLGQDILKLSHNMDTTSLATTFPFTTSELTANEGIIYGLNEHNGSLIVFDRFTMENANMVVFAKSGAGKSIAKDEAVIINDGNKIFKTQIGNLIDKLIEEKGVQFRDNELEGVVDPKIKVFSFNKNLKGEWSTVSLAARKKSPENLYRFKTASGRVMKVTDDHSLVVLREGIVTSLKSPEIKLGDVVPLPRELPEPEKTLQYLDTREVLKAQNYHYIRIFIKPNMRLGSRLRKIGSSLPFKIELSEKFANLLGFIASEGWIGESYVTISNFDQVVHQIIIDALQELELNYFTIKKEGKICQINIPSQVFTQFLHGIGANGKSESKQIPGFIFNCSNTFLANFLKAYFEGDGTVSNHEVSAVTKSTSLASDLSYLLLRFGIVARLRVVHKRATNVQSSQKHPYYQIVISGQENIIKFAGKIGFISEGKNLKLSQISQKKANNNVDTIPVPKDYLEEVYNLLYNSHNIVSPKNLSAIKRGVFDPSPHVFKTLLEDIDRQIVYFSTVTAKRLNYLKKLPRLNLIIGSGKLLPSVNTILWKELGQSWRLAKNGTVVMGIGNALRANQVIFNESYDFKQIKQEIITSFAELNISLGGYDRSLNNYLHYSKSQTGSYQRILDTIDYLIQNYDRKISELRSLEQKLLVLKTLATSDLYWDPITEITLEKNTDSYVYDLTVDNQVFLAGFGGLFVHNSYLVKLEALRSLMFGAQVIVIDPEQEYKRLADSVGGEYINFSSDSPVKINPFDLSDIATPGENELGRKTLSLTGFLKLVLGDLDPSQAAILDRAIISTYRLKGITQDPATQTQPAPLMEDLYKVLLGMEDPRAQELAFRLERFIKGSLAGIFSAPSNLNLNNQLIVFSIRELADQLRPLAMYLILDYIWTQVRKTTKKRLLIVDEAWYMMKNPDSAAFLVEMCKRARKYYLGVSTITQDVEDFLGTDRGKEIITNSSIQVLLKQSPAAIDGVAKTFNLSEGEKRLLLSSGVGQGLFFAGPSHVAMRVISSEDEHQLITTNPAELLKQKA